MKTTLRLLFQGAYVVAAGLFLGFANPDNRPVFFSAAGGMVLLGTAIWVGVGDRGFASRLINWLVAWTLMVLVWGFLRLRDRPRAFALSPSEMQEQYVIPLLAVVASAVVVGSGIGRAIRSYHHRWNASELSL